MHNCHASILVVDDDELVRDLFARHLGHAGYAVSSAAGGGECLEKLRRESFDLLLLDISMPDMDGRDVLQQIRQQPRHATMPIVMLSAIRDKAVVIKTLYLGASDYLAKPCNWVVVKQRIARLLRSAAAPPTVEGQAVDNARILIVDDDEMSRDLLGARVKAAGYRASFASGGAEALAAMAAQCPDLVMLDMSMPGMDGAEVLRRMRADPQLAELPVIIVSAQDDSETMAAMLEAGADEYLTKPYHALILAQRLHSCLAAHRAAQDERARQRRLQELDALGASIRATRDPV